MERWDDWLVQHTKAALIWDTDSFTARDIAHQGQLTEDLVMESLATFNSRVQRKADNLYWNADDTTSEHQHTCTYMFRMFATRSHCGMLYSPHPHGLSGFRPRPLLHPSTSTHLYTLPKPSCLGYTRIANLSLARLFGRVLQPRHWQCFMRLLGNGEQTTVLEFRPVPPHATLLLRSRNSRPSLGLPCHPTFHSTHTRV